jgi:hypothetical protein
MWIQSTRVSRSIRGKEERKRESTGAATEVNPGESVHEGRPSSMIGPVGCPPQGQSPLAPHYHLPFYFSLSYVKLAMLLAINKIYYPIPSAGTWNCSLFIANKGYCAAVYDAVFPIRSWNSNQSFNKERAISIFRQE